MKTTRTDRQAARRSMKDLTAKASGVVKGGKQKPDGTAAGNVAAKWNVARGAVA